MIIYSDISPYNVILLPIIFTDIMVIIDWEFIINVFYAFFYRVIEMLFKKFTINGFNAKYEYVNEFRNAF
jgi:hypothetical protein